MKEGLSEMAIYDIELISNGSSKMDVIKIINKVCGNLKQAKAYADSAPCIIVSNAADAEAQSIIAELRSVGAKVRLIEKEREFIQPISNPGYITPAQNNTTHLNERELLFNIWLSYSKHDEALETAGKQRNRIQLEIKKLNDEIKKIENEIDKNQMIKRTAGEYMRPRVYKKTSLFDFDLPEFEILMWTAIIMAISAFIAMLILVAVKPQFIENLSLKLHVREGTMVWLGAPIIGISCAILVVLIFVIVQFIYNISSYADSVKRHNNFDAKGALDEATAFFNNIDKYTDEKNKKEQTVSELRTRLSELLELESTSISRKF